ncbi:MAG TPA: hypothetical protein VIG05_00115 [Candidatus Nitrosotenuis sp.]
MALIGSHKRIFQIETGMVAVMIAASLKKLMESPSDKYQIDTLLNYVDVIIGDAKFLRDDDLEENAKTIRDFFMKSEERRTSLEISLLLDRFRELIWG